MAGRRRAGSLKLTTQSEKAKGTGVYIPYVLSSADVIMLLSGSLVSKNLDLFWKLGHSLEKNREVEPMPVITISREIYSEGSYIGEKVAEALGYHFVDKNTMEKVFAEHSIVQLSEVCKSEPGFWARFDDMRATTIKFLKQVILALARHGEMVIVGRGAFAVLGTFADVLNVRVQSPFLMRVRRAMEKERIADYARAEALLKEWDRERDAFVKSFYDIRWVDTAAASAFDLVINTDKVSPDVAVAWLIQALTGLKERKPDRKFTTSTIEVDTALANTVSEVLGCHVTH